jgi:hypothetical protein
VATNAFAVTVGAGMVVVGSSCAIGVRALVGEGNVGSGWTTAMAVVGSLAAAGIAAGFRRGRLGPDEVDEPRETVIAIARGLLDGLQAVWRTPSVAAGFAALISHRVAFGVATLLALLLYRYAFTDQGWLRAGLPGVGQAVAAGGVGVVLAAVITPVAAARVGRPTTVRVALGFALLAVLALALPMRLPTTLVATFALAWAGQVVKLCLDAEVQLQIGDQVRGRVFALYDTVFNIGYVIAALAAAVVAPLDGRSAPLLLAAAGTYLAGLAAYTLLVRRRQGVTKPGSPLR